MQAPMELPSSLALYAFGALQLITTAGVTWVVRTVYRLDRSHATMRVTLVGESGQNGINGEVKSLRGRMHKVENEVHGLKGQGRLHEQRLNRLDPEGA